jgi:hypothetical protein
LREALFCEHGESLGIFIRTVVNAGTNVYKVLVRMALDQLFLDYLHLTVYPSSRRGVPFIHLLLCARGITMPTHPLAEVFGFPTDNLSDEAERFRKDKLCPYYNKVPSCTKDKALDPLGVCTVYSGDSLAITCPIRLRQDWLVIEGAARFFFPTGTKWTSLQEIRLNDANGVSAGNIDFVLVSYDDKGHITNFGSLEVQAVYISGNVRRPFEYYMSDRRTNQNMVWTSTNVRPDYLSSSRKRLLPQMIHKGNILKNWGKKQAVALHKTFYKTLPALTEVPVEKADLAWLVYDLVLNAESNHYQLVHSETIYTSYKPALDQIITTTPGPIDEFESFLQQRLHDIGNNNSSPEAPTLSDIVGNH